MKKSHINPLPRYFDRYINLIEDIELDQAMDNSLQELADFDWEKCRATGLQVYAPGKWTIPDILQHIIDWERIMSYRALVFAREVSKKAVGYDEDIMAKNARASQRSLDDLLDELTGLRQSSRRLFNSFDEQQLQQSGICWESEMSALALGFTIAGHQRHHLNIIRERYFLI